MKKETAIYPSHRKLLGTTLAAAIMTTLSCLLVIVQPHGKVGLVIGIVGAVFFGGCICILFIVLLKNFFRNRPTLLLTPDSLRIYVPAKGIYITIEWQRIADFSVFRTYGQKFIRIELHDPDRAIDEEKNRIAKGLMRWQMKYFGSPYAITASTVDIGTAELEKILREYLQASREKSAANSAKADYILSGGDPAKNPMRTDRPSRKSGSPSRSRISSEIRSHRPSMNRIKI